MILRVLGSAAGGGVPQWNCACGNCDAARRGSAPRRLQSSFAFSADLERWWLVNLSPDIAAQIEGYPPLRPRERRGTPIVGMLLTDANIDHVGGFASLRQTHATGFDIYSSPVVRDVARSQSAFAPFALPPHRWYAVDAPLELDAALRVTPIVLPGLTPGYDQRRAVHGAVLGYRIEDRESGGSALFAPVFAGVDDALRAAVAAADVAFLDGSFWSDDEMERGALDDKTARRLGHLPVGGPDGSLAALAGSGTRLLYAHLNNSNPLLDPDSAARSELLAYGAEIAYDGLEMVL